jgi:hypothetical protein
VARDGYRYFTANQLHRRAHDHGGKDLRQERQRLFPAKIGATPVLLAG